MTQFGVINWTYGAHSDDVQFGLGIINYNVGSTAIPSEYSCSVSFLQNLDVNDEITVRVDKVGANGEIYNLESYLLIEKV